MKPSIAVFLSGLVLGQTVPYVRTKTDDGKHCLRWPVNAGARGSIQFVQSSTGDPALGSGVFDAVTRSAQTWETQLQACGNLDLAETGQHSTSRFVGYTQNGPNENLVLLRLQLCSAVVPPGDSCLAAGTCGNVHDCWDHGSTVVALTTSSYVVSSGEVLDADVEMNAASATPTLVDSPPCSPGAISTSCVANDVQNAVTHEFGHFLGLAHSPDPSSTMYASEPLGETSKRVLDSGSKQFVCDAYPAGQASQDCSSSTSSGCSTAGRSPPVAPGVLLLLLSLGIRRHRKQPA
ncbi:MAG TPA: myxosortase-dependent metalloprotease, MXAN_2677/MXAN_2678 family [Myxococcaceae bacterium]|jgi:hypothetical protein